MTSLAVFGIACSGLTAVVLYAYCLKTESSLAAQMERLRRSDAYRQLYGLIAALNSHDIDEIRIECSGITITSVCPAHTLLDFSFKQNGNSIRNDSFTRLYAELIAQDFPAFTQKYFYKLRRYTVYRPNGKAEQAYAFIMRRGYKDYLLAERNPAQLRIY